MGSIRNIALSEVGIIESFFDEHWRKNHIFSRNRDLLNWFYRDSPYRARYSDGYSVRASFNELDESLAGLFAYIPFLFNHYGKKYMGCYLSAWWASPIKKSDLLGLRMLNELQNHMDFSICISGMNTPIALKIYRGLKWHVIDNMPRLFLITSHEETKHLMGERYSEIEMYLSLKKFNAYECINSSKSVRNIEFLSEINEFDWNKFYWGVIAKTYSGPAKELTFLKWRYESIPIFKYMKLGLFDGNKIIGLLIYRVEQVKDHDILVMRIVDIICSLEYVNILMSKAVSEAIKLNCALVDYISNSHQFDSSLMGIGFQSAIRSDNGNYILPYLFQPISFELLSLNAAYWIHPNIAKRESTLNQNFNLVKGDYEFDRPT